MTHPDNVAIIALMRAVTKVSGKRGYRIVRGAMTHVLADVLEELNAEGWHLVRSRDD